MSEKRMKPCPFCGKDPYVQKHYISQNKAQYAIKCRCGVLTHFYDRRYKAVEIWNRRTHET